MITDSFLASVLENLDQDTAPADPRQHSRRAAEAVASILQDLDRRWQVPPVLFARELARQTVLALRQDPELLRPLVDEIVEQVVRGLFARLYRE